MIYTIGSFRSYRLTYREYGEIIKTGKRVHGSAFLDGYTGGYAFQTLEDAQRRIKEAYADKDFVPWAMRADWDAHTYPAEDGWWHYLLIDAEIIWPPLLIKGTQIIYVPDHADGLEHPDCEAGFVTSMRGETVFCRYWRRGENNLRTTANSEGTPIDNLVITKTRSREVVQEALEQVDILQKALYN